MADVAVEDMVEAVVAVEQVEVFMVEVGTLAATVAGTPEDSAAGILRVDTVLHLYHEDTTEGIMQPLYLGHILVDTGLPTTVGIVEDIMAVIEAGTIEDTMAPGITEVITTAITRIGDYGDGDSGDGLFWDGPMLAGLTMAMEDTHI